MTHRILSGILLAAVLSVFPMLRAMAQTSGSEAIKGIFEQYPAATLQDVYKSFFQDRFGPGHLVGDTAAARNYLRRELQQMTESVGPYYEPAGRGRNFYRVNLSVIRDGLISEDDYFRAFLQSADRFSLPSVTVWAKEWEEIVKDVPQTTYNYAADKALIDSLLASGRYEVSHSRRFKEAYRPHYRLIDRHIFETVILRCLQVAGKHTSSETSD